jgi:hypothetical protein
MHGYDLAAFAGFFTAVTAAAAALTGLLFVAVSINLDHILGDSTSKDSTTQGTAASDGTPKDNATQGTAASDGTPKDNATQGITTSDGTANGSTANGSTANGSTASDGTANHSTANGTSMLPARAAETLAMLLFVVIISALALVPQDVELLGAEILVIALPLTVITTRNQLKFRRQNPDSPLLWSASRMTASSLALLPGTIAGVSLAAHGGGGLYWLAPAALGGIAGAVYSAWVLLVEIVR